MQSATRKTDLTTGFFAACDVIGKALAPSKLGEELDNAAQPDANYQLTALEALTYGEPAMAGFTLPMPNRSLNREPAWLHKLQAQTKPSGTGS